MFCSKCGHQNEDSAAFCNGCGAALQAKTAATSTSVEEQSLTSRAKVRSSAVTTAIGAAMNVVAGIPIILNSEDLEALGVFLIALGVVLLLVNGIILKKAHHILSKLLSIVSLAISFAVIFFAFAYSLGGIATMGVHCFLVSVVAIGTALVLIGSIKCAIAAFSSAKR